MTAAADVKAFQPSRGRSRHASGVVDILVSKLNVIKALILHDIKLRGFGNGLGYIFSTTYIGAYFLCITIFHTFKGGAYYGHSEYLYMAVGIAPWVATDFITKNASLSIHANRSFLSYAPVKCVDLITARCVLELASTFVVLCVGLAIFSAVGINPLPPNVLDAVFGEISSVVLGIGLGFFFGTVGNLIPLVKRIQMLLMLVIHVTSGIYFEPMSVPPQAWKVLTWNPLLHSVMWIRSAYFVDYPHSLLSKGYVFGFAFVAFFIGCVLLQICDAQLRMK